MTQAAGQYRQPNQLGVALIVTDDDRAPHAVDGKDRQVIPLCGPGFSELDFVISLDDASLRINHDRRVQESRSVPRRGPDDRVHVQVPA